MTKSILIADDDNDMLDLLTYRCRLAGLKVHTANNAMMALSKIESSRPDCVILDYEMPNGNGLSVCEMMANHQELRSIPVIILTASCKEDTVRRCHQLGAYYVLKCTDMWSRIQPILNETILNKGNTMSDSTESKHDKSDVDTESDSPTEPMAMMDAVFAILGAEGDGCFEREEVRDVTNINEQPWVLSIEDDDDFALALRLRLQELGVQVIRATGGGEGYRRAFLDSPRAILLDYELPEGNGDYVIRRLKETPATCDIPVIALTGRREAYIEQQMRNLGVVEFLTKPFDWKQLRKALEGHLEDRPVAVKS